MNYDPAKQITTGDSLTDKWQNLSPALFASQAMHDYLTARRSWIEGEKLGEFDYAKSHNHSVILNPPIIDEAEEVHPNPNLEGGAASGPDDGANPPTNYSIGFNTVDSVPTATGWDTNADEETGRSFLEYDIQDNHPGLEVGTVLRYSIPLTNKSATGTRIVATNGITGCVVTWRNGVNIEAGETVTLIVDIEITDAVYAGKIRSGVGVTTNRTENVLHRTPISVLQYPPGYTPPPPPVQYVIPQPVNTVDGDHGVIRLSATSQTLDWSNFVPMGQTILPVNGLARSTFFYWQRFGPLFYIAPMGDYTAPEGVALNISFSGFTIDGVLPITESTQISGTWAKESAASGITQITFTVGGRQYDCEYSDDSQLTGTWTVSVPLQLTDDNKVAAASMRLTSGEVATASAGVLLNHVDALTGLEGHPVARETPWNWIPLQTPVWQPDPIMPKRFVSEHSYTGHEGCVFLDNATIAHQTVANNENGYAGQSVMPQFGISIPENVSVGVNVLVNGTPVRDELVVEGPIIFMRRPDEITICIEEVPVEDGDTVRIELRAIGDVEANGKPVLQYTNHEAIPQGSWVLPADPLGIYFDANEGNDATGEVGNPNLPFATGDAVSRDPFWDSLPATGPDEFITFYLPRGHRFFNRQTANNPSGDGEGDWFYVKGDGATGGGPPTRRCRIMATPRTTGAAPIIDGTTLRSYPEWLESPSFPPISGNRLYEPGVGGQNGLVVLRECLPGSFIECIHVMNSRSTGISVEVNQVSPFVSDGNTIRYCRVEFCGADNYLARGRNLGGDDGSPPSHPVTNVHIHDCYGWEGCTGYRDDDLHFNRVGGQALTVTLAQGVLVERVELFDYRKEGFDKIACIDSLVRRCVAQRAYDAVYGAQRGTAFYMESTHRLSDNNWYEDCICIHDSTGGVMGTEGRGIFRNSGYRNVEVYDVMSNCFGIIAPSNGTRENLTIEHCSGVTDGRMQFAVRETGSPATVGVNFINNILQGDQRTIFSTVNGDWVNPNIDGNCLYSPTGTVTGETGTNAIVDENPQFVSNTDLRIPVTSPAAGQVENPIRSTDIKGRPIARPDSIGAYNAGTED